MRMRVKRVWLQVLHAEFSKNSEAERIASQQELLFKVSGEVYSIDGNVSCGSSLFVRSTFGTVLCTV